MREVSHRRDTVRRKAPSLLADRNSTVSTPRDAVEWIPLDPITSVKPWPIEMLPRLTGETR
jgi:hypothetical protein